MIKRSRICWDCQARKCHFRSGKALLKNFYLIRKLSTNKIAAIFGCSGPTVKRWLVYYGIPRRHRGGNQNPDGRNQWGRD